MIAQTVESVCNEVTYIQASVILRAHMDSKAIHKYYT